jgi:hypothetical protein
MTTLLEKPIKRALKIKGGEYVVALSPQSVKLTLKGHRNGAELKWIDLISGDAALATALQASIGKFTPSCVRRTTSAGISSVSMSIWRSNTRNDNQHRSFD